MGAGQSFGRGGAAEGQEVKTSYYELLGVERQATEEEIKKAYRRKALELHPDRNYGREEAATTTFAEVQAAYEVLSDAQERAWYDSHESAILRGDDAAGTQEAPVFQNVRITTADDLARMLRKFNSNVEFSDSPSGFFGYLRETFAQLVKEEEIAGSWENVDVLDWPSFGHKDDGYDDVVKKFYSAWLSFSTVKNFAWKDKWKLSEAADRWVRRRMEQENKAMRKEAIKEFNEAVRSLVAFVRKRDPRYEPSQQNEAERQKVLRDAAAAQAARARAANQAKFAEAVPEWTKAREPDELEESEEEEIEEEVFECVACNKIFKSEKQWEAHEKSKKHQKAVYALQKKMRKENAHLDLSDANLSSGVATPEVEQEHEEEQDVLDDLTAEVEDHEARTNGLAADEGAPDDQGEHKNTSDEEKPPPQPQPVQKDDEDASDSQSDNSDSDYASLKSIQTRLQSTTLDTPATSTLPSNVDESEGTEHPDKGSEDPQSAQPKLGKAAQKRAKKAAAAASTEQTSSQYTCSTCQSEFPSRTQLFDHIKDFKHAALKTVGPGGSGSGKGKKAKGKR